MELSRTIRKLAFFLAIALAGTGANAVSLPHIFGNNMVLQRGQPVPVWGKGAPSEEIVVSFAGQNAKTRVGEDGKWRIDLKPLETNAEGAVFTVKGDN